MGRRLREDALQWLINHQDVLAAYDGTQRDAVINEMKAAGVFRTATANHFIRIDLYIEVAKAR